MDDPIPISALNQYAYCPRRWINDDLQLAAQALCLEETLGRAVTRSAIYPTRS